MSRDIRTYTHAWSVAGAVVLGVQVVVVFGAGDHGGHPQTASSRRVRPFTSNSDLERRTAMVVELLGAGFKGNSRRCD